MKETENTVQRKKMWVADQGDGTYINPILYTDYSDPDAIRVGEDYFMIASSFCNTPAVPLLHSKDLVNWKVVNYIIDKLPYSYYDKPMHGCGTWAPAIRSCPAPSTRPTTAILTSTSPPCPPAPRSTPPMPCGGCHKGRWKDENSAALPVFRV